MKHRLVLAASTAFLINTSLPANALDFGNIIGKSLSKGVQSMQDSKQVAKTSEADEITIGRNLAGPLLGKYKPIQNEALQRYINNVGMWIALQSSRPKLPWRFAAVEGSNVNAFALPGGVVVVTRGMLNMLSNEAELACVLGHEVAHVDQQHHLKVLEGSVAQKGFIDGAVEGVGDEIGKQGFGGQVVVGLTKDSAQAGANKLMTLRLDRGAESEADHEGILLAAKAGYDPGACLTFMQRLASGKTATTLMEDLGKTHPPAADRATDVEESLRRLKGATPGEGARPPLNLNLSMTDSGKKKKN
jgi:predicted Zn-dependent protease